MKTRRLKHKKMKKTRRAIQTKKSSMTIPELRRGFESVENMARRKPTVDAFMKHWMKIFGKPISKKAAEEYINFMSKGKRGKKMQSGGESPVGYEMRPGQATTPDGAYQNYVSKGFFVAEPGHPNCMKGGSVLSNIASTAAAYINHPYNAYNPPSYMQIAAKDFIGQPMNVSGDITKLSPNYFPVSHSVAPNILAGVSNVTTSR